MKPSRRNQAREAQRQEKLAQGKPVLSKYEQKVRRGPSELIKKDADG